MKAETNQNWRVPWTACQKPIGETAICLLCEQEATDSELLDPKRECTDGNALNQFRYTQSLKVPRIAWSTNLWYQMNPGLKPSSACTKRWVFEQAAQT